MPVGFSIAVAIIFIAGGIYCRGSKRLRTTSKCMLFFGCLMALYSILTIIMLHRGYHQLTRTHKVLEAKQHGITVSSSFEIQPVFLHSSSLFCHTLWLLKLKDPKELVLRAIQGRGAQYYWM